MSPTDKNKYMPRLNFKFARSDQWVWHYYFHFQRDFYGFYTKWEEVLVLTQCNSIFNSSSFQTHVKWSSMRGQSYAVTHNSLYFNHGQQQQHSSGLLIWFILERILFFKKEVKSVTKPPLEYRAWFNFGQSRWIRKRKRF